jgi:TRAP-type C4-dicarboxylate transport system substrate-binding protein
LDKLPPDLQQVIKGTAKEMAPFERNIIKTDTGMMTDVLKQKGMEIVEVDRVTFQKASQPVYKQFEPQFGKELIDNILAAGK